ncbi:hypothetical protein MKW92_046287 [Papaver armeniacum]|nr:hypothetical protein MKW92_046287 [Papaver armeniacum]
MVDALVSFAVEKLGDALIGETIFLLGVRTQVEELRDELRRMRCFLKDADAKQQQGDERVRNWVADIRDVAYDAEDVVDTFMLKIDAGRRSGGVQNFIIRKALMVKNLKYLHRVGNEIQAIQSRLKVISDTSSSKTNKMMQQQLRNYYPHVEDDVIIGLEEHTKTLLTELLKDDERRCIVSIVGVGGLGKTTLAKKIYKHDTIMSHFECCAWSSISQQLNTRDALLEIIKKSMHPNDDEFSRFKELNEGDLVEKLYNYLQDKRFLVVVDDLWSLEDWNTLSHAFPNGKRGSKVLLTTRNKEVASQADPWNLQLEPQLLNDEDSWALLCNKAFPKTMGDANCYPPSLEKLGRNMVHKCGGLPLAICVLGGILATKKAEIKEWEYVSRDITSNINKGKNGGVMGILELSYNDLPVHLKPCFLYLGLFPEDYAIPRKKLVRLWIAEGFIRHTKEDALVTLEDVGKREYYAELIQRCMIQADKDTNPWEGKTCRMHDLMRDLCLSKAKEMNFLDIFDHHIGGVTSSSLSTTDKCRRLRRYAIYLDYHDIWDDEIDFDSVYDEFYFNNSACSLRTFLFSVPKYHHREPFIKYQHMKLLRVLDLENLTNFRKDITKEVSKLIHLRYFAFGKGPPDTPISSSIGNLRNLQTIKLGRFQGLLLPGTIANLAQLRHLELGSSKTLNHIQAGEWVREGCLQRLSKLRSLSVENTSRMQTDVLIQEIVNINRSSSSSDQHHNPIRVLRIDSFKKINIKIFDSLSCCHNLHQLDLTGKLNYFDLQKYPPNLSKLTLRNTFLFEDPMAALQYLPSLTVLSLDENTYKGSEIMCSSKGFPQLQYLYMSGVEGAKTWILEKGGMPRLQHLHLCGLSYLSMLPEGLMFITTLKKLEIIRTFIIQDRVAREVGKDWYKVQHIPSITIAREVGESWSKV